jgi:hypothetical protein
MRRSDAITHDARQVESGRVLVCCCEIATVAALSTSASPARAGSSQQSGREVVSQTGDAIIRRSRRFLGLRQSRSDQFAINIRHLPSANREFKLDSASLPSPVASHSLNS